MLSEIGKRNVGVIDAPDFPELSEIEKRRLMSIDSGVPVVIASSMVDLDSFVFCTLGLNSVRAIWFPVLSERREASMSFIDCASGQCPS